MDGSQRSAGAGLAAAGQLPTNLCTDSHLPPDRVDGAKVKQTLLNALKWARGITAMPHCRQTRGKQGNVSALFVSRSRPLKTQWKDARKDERTEELRNSGLEKSSKHHLKLCHLVMTAVCLELLCSVIFISHMNEGEIFSFA
ncbi:hypothetical protein LDENG_00182390 [Lucifuga dentata]|nr:hypothetical protein LDENG_00182390 [Lucifuga dentata]